MTQTYSVAGYNEQLEQKYIRLQKKCPLSRSASYEQYINWLVKRYGVYFQEDYLPFCMLLKNRGFPPTTCKIREDIVDKLKTPRKRDFEEIRCSEIKPFKCPGAPVRFLKSLWDLSKTAPSLSEHNNDVYRDDLGYSTEQLVQLQQSGIV